MNDDLIQTGDMFEVKKGRIVLSMCAYNNEYADRRGGCTVVGSLPSRKNPEHASRQGTVVFKIAQ